MKNTVRIESSPANAGCQIIRARLSEFQGLVKLGKSTEAIETLADIEDVISVLATQIDSKER